MKKVSLLVILVFAVSMLAWSLSSQEAEKEKAPEKSEKTEKEDVIKLVESKPFYYCAVEMTGSYDQHASAFMTLYNAAAQQSLPMNEAPFGIYWNAPSDTPVEELKWDIGLPVPEDKEIQEPLKKKKWDYTLLVVTGFDGVFESEEMFGTYGKVYQWIDKNGYQPAGPMMEKFLTTPSQNEEGEVVGKVEIVIPVEKKKE